MRDKAKSKDVNLEKLAHDLRSILGVMKTLEKLAASLPETPEQALELHGLAIEKLEAAIGELEI